MKDDIDDIYAHVSDLDDAQAQLIEEINTKPRSWMRIYMLLDAVASNALYMEAKYGSFTKWLKEFANVCDIHESQLWKYMKAGNVYRYYYIRMKYEGKDIGKIDDVKISPYNLDLIDKIAQGNPKIVDDLIGRVASGAVTRSDLRSAWLKIKADKGENAMRVNGYTPFSVSLDDMLDPDSAAAKTIGVTNIVNGIMSDYSWLPSPEPDAKDNLIHYRRGRYQSTYTKPICKCLTGLPVSNEKIDIVVLENISTGDYHVLDLHGIVIVVTKNDLYDADISEKMSGYNDYMDYLWLCVPYSLASEAEKTAPNWVGIIMIDESKKVKKHRNATKTKGTMRVTSLTNAIIGMCETIR